MLKNIANLPKNLLNFLFNVVLINILFITFLFFKIITSLLHKISQITKVRFFETLSNGIFSIYRKFSLALDPNTGRKIPKFELLEMANKNILSRRSRTIITIFGLMIGIGSVVFLLSFGYGVQDSVVNRIANLNQMKQIDVYPRRGDKLPLNDESITNIKGISGVENVFPVSTLVSKVNNKDSVTDVATYAVTTGYLNLYKDDLLNGKMFESNDEIINVSKSTEVKGVSTTNVKDSKETSNIEFSLLPSTWIKVYSSPDTKSEVIGFTKRVDDNLKGEILWGNKYSDKKDSEIQNKAYNGDPIEQWVKTSFPIWTNKDCIKNVKYCVDKKYTQLKDKKSVQVTKEGYIPLSMVISLTESGKVLGTLDLIDLEATTDTPKALVPLKLPTTALKEVLVNKDFLKLMNIDQRSAVDKTMKLSFVYFTKNADNENVKQATEQVEYKIVGVLNDNLETPIMYVPLRDLKPINLNSYNTLKVIASSRETVNTLRKQIETSGYTTTSVLDVIVQIENIFQTVKIVLLMLGLMALIVSAVGMFNTLTVSLLERTREIGLLKTMGMGSKEIHDLFLIESLTIGFYGGFSGLVFGFLFGKLISFLLYFFSIVKINDPFELTKIPSELLIFVAVISLVTGVLTGIYPARRATKISALAALKYE